VETASDGEQAIQTMKNRVPDLLILDVLMPGKSGYDVLNWVRNESSTCNVPVIMISGCPLPDDHVKLLNLGAGAVVPKSESLGSLFEKIDAMVMSPGPGACPAAFSPPSC